jgi:hypothetical protein
MPLSHISVTTVASGPRRSATRNAAVTFAPVETPANETFVPRETQRSSHRLVCRDALDAISEVWSPQRDDKAGGRSSFPQCINRVELRGTPGWRQTGEQRHQRERDRHTARNDRISRVDRVEVRRQIAGPQNGPNQADANSLRHNRHPALQDEPNDTPSVRAERNPYSDLGCAGSETLGQNRVQTDEGHEQRHRGKGEGDQGH